jgi:hypothetical protein
MKFQVLLLQFILATSSTLMASAEAEGSFRDGDSEDDGNTRIIGGSQVRQSYL